MFFTVGRPTFREAGSGKAAGKHEARAQISRQDSDQAETGLCSMIVLDDKFFLKTSVLWHTPILDCKQ